MTEIKEGTVGRHKKTGEQLVRRDGKWVPVEVAPPQAPVAPPVTQPEESGIMRGLGLVGRAIAPYAAAAGTGAAVGAPFAGVGAIPGAAAGVTAYGLSELADALLMGGKGRQAVERGLTAIGLPEPQTAAERVGYEATRAMTGASGIPRTAQTIATNIAAQRGSTQGQRIASLMAQNPSGQVLGAGTGAATAQTATEIGAPAPLAMAAGIAGGALPYGRVATPRQTVAEKEFAAARPEGYVVPPASVRPTVGNIALESVSGKAALQQIASGKNQEVTNRLAAEAVGLPAGEQITKPALERVRAESGKVYEKLKSFGAFSADNDFYSDIATINAESQELLRAFPDLPLAGAEKINNLVNAINQPNFDSKTAVTLVKTLRQQATKHFSGAPTAEEQALGAAKRKAADAMEALISRRLAQSGDTQLINEFNDARTRIAKTYSIENALELSGNVNAKKLAAQLKADKPLTGGLRTAAQFAGNFPKASVTPETYGSPGVSALDAAMAAGGTSMLPIVGAPGILAAGLPLARPVTRSVALSRMLQNRLERPPSIRRRGMTGATYGALTAPNSQEQE
jgi:hypothetical protein